MLRQNETLTPPTDRGVSLDGGRSVASIDWLTVTTEQDRPGKAWADIFAGIAGENGHSFTKPWSFWGFTGWQTEHCRYGFRPMTREYILIVSGSPADRVWRKVCPSARTVTRLDLAVTVKMESVQPGLCAAYYAVLGAGMQRKYSLITNNSGGETLYVGSRHSSQFGRVYDKGAQLGQAPGELYRYEAVIKKSLTPSLLNALLVGPGDGSDEKGLLKHKIRSFVWDWFDNREVTPVFARGEQGKLELSVEFTASTTDRKLNWLSHAVSPTIRKLMAEGRSKDVIEALSLEALMLAHDVPSDL